MFKSLLVAVLVAALCVAGLAVPYNPYPAQRYALVIQDDSPLSYYPFDDYPAYQYGLRDAVTALQTGAQYVGSVGISGEPFGASGALAVGGNRALNLDAVATSGGLVQISNPTLVGVLGRSTGGSLEFWFRPAALPVTEQVILTSTASATCGGRDLTISINAAGVVLVRNSANSALLVGSGAVGIVRLTVGSWTHVAVTVSAPATTSVIALHLNGVQVASASIAANTLALSGGSCFLRLSGNGYFDELAAFDGNISVSRIYAHYFVGYVGGCRTNPCFSGVECTPLGSTAYVCATCPAGYTGDGITCTSSTTTRRNSLCGNPPATGGVTYNYTICASGCNTRSRCMQCALEFPGVPMWVTRGLCHQGAQVGALFAGRLGAQYPWNSVTPTVSPSRTPSSTRSPSLSSSITPTRTPTISITPSRTLAITPTPSTVTNSGSLLFQSASYGSNCGACASSPLAHVRSACDGRYSCTYLVDASAIGDPCPGCAKTYSYTYKCGTGGSILSGSVSSEASGQSFTVGCSAITVQSATYGANCGSCASHPTSHIATACNGRTTCTYSINHSLIGDPCGGCAKTYSVTWLCSSGTFTANASAEASGRSVTLSC